MRVNPCMAHNFLDRPSKIRIGPLEYAVRWYDRAEEDEKGCYGYTDSNEMEIGISERRPKLNIADTFMHEAVHALWYVLGMKDKEDEETVASRFGIGLSMIARDNPDLFRWWLSLFE